MIAERNDENLDELAVLSIERQALIQASLEVLAGVCCEGEEEQEQVSASTQLYPSAVCTVLTVLQLLWPDFRSSDGYKQHTQRS